MPAEHEHCGRSDGVQIPSPPLTHCGLGRLASCYLSVCKMEIALELTHRIMRIK